MLKLLIVDAAEDFRMALAEAMKGMYIIKTCDDGQSALELARTFSPDLLILDLMISGVDGLSLVQMIAQIRGKPIVLATTRFQSVYVLDAATRVGIDYIVVKPCSLQAVVNRLADLVDSRIPNVVTMPDPQITVANLLRSLGFTSGTKGYTYLREAVPIYAKDPQQAITKELYPEVAKRCGGNAKLVERDIRTAIDRAWKYSDKQIWKLYFQTLPDGSLKRPSNAVFIARIAETLFEQLYNNAL